MPELQRVPLTLGVTGHRDLLGEEIPAIESRLRELFDQLAGRYPDTPLRLLTPLAEGGDRIAARVARKRGIELLVPLPMPASEYESDFADEASRLEFREFLADATVVDVRAARRSLEGDRDQAYAQVGIYSSDHCQIMIAIWDGKPARLGGGTADVVEYHQFGDMDGLGLELTGRRGLAKDDTDLVYHVVCSRERDDGAPAEGLKPGTARWLVANPERVEIDGPPANLDRMLARTGEFNRDVARVVRKSRASSALSSERIAAVLPGWTEKLAGQPDLARTAETFAVADLLATRYARRYRIALRVLYILAALMGIAFIAYADLDRSSMIAAYLGLFFLGFVVYRLASGLQWHRKFLDYRALAEGLRVQFYWRLAGVSGQLRNDFAYDNFLQKQDVEIGWIRNVMRFAGAPEDRLARRKADLDGVIEHKMNSGAPSAPMSSKHTINNV